MTPRNSVGIESISSRSRRSGLAMVVVLIVAGMLGVFAVTMMRVSRNEDLYSLAERDRRVCRCASQGAAHRGLALLRRNPTVRGSVTNPGPESSVGAIANVSINDTPSGRILVTATASYNGASVTTQIFVDPARL